MRRRIVILLALAALVLPSLPVSAHSWGELNDFLDGWWNRHRIAFRHDTGATPFTGNYRLPAIYAEMEDMLARHPGWDGDYLTGPIVKPHTPRSTAPRGMGTNVEQWRSLVATYFAASDVDRALCLMAYESGGNPYARNPRSSATGLMQVMYSTWGPYFGLTSRSQLEDPATNLRIAAVIRSTQGWIAWSPYKRGHCR